MRKMKIILGIVLIALILSPFAYVQINKLLYAQKVTRYLIEEQHYKQDQLKSVTGVWGIKLPPFYAVVVFADEPDVEYIYFAHNQVLQFEHRITEEGKQKGITDSNLKHYVPLPWE